MLETDVIRQRGEPIMVGVAECRVGERVGRRSIGLGLLGDVVAAALAAPVADAVVVVAADRGDAERPNALDHASRIGSVAHEIAEAVDLGNACRSDVGEHRIERRQVAVHVGEERDAAHHQSLVSAEVDRARSPRLAEQLGLGGIGASDTIACPARTRR